MLRQQVLSQSPLRILERTIHGGLGSGKLSVVMSRAGVGKTAFLVQVGLDGLTQQKDVLHVALGQSIEHVRAWYDGLFDDLVHNIPVEDIKRIRADVDRRRFIHTQADKRLSPEQLDAKIALVTEHLKLKPALILIDGYNWKGEADDEAMAAELSAYKKSAERIGATLWLSAQTHRETTGDHPEKIPQPCAACDELIDVALYLEPQAHLVSVRIMKDRDNPKVDTSPIALEPGTLQLVREDGATKPMVLPAEAFTLLSGAANGAEEAFGACAQEWGCMERNFTFAGRKVNRDRGLVELSDDEIKQGEVSNAYVESQLHRKFPKTPIFQKMLHSIWHQVATSKQVFSVGEILDDQTVKGGTGWATELAKHFNKPVFVFDQPRVAWFTWRDGEWVATAQPKIGYNRFTGTGTRFLTDKGRAAIRGLFAASFGPPPAKN